MNSEVFPDGTRHVMQQTANAIVSITETIVAMQNTNGEAKARAAAQLVRDYHALQAWGSRLAAIAYEQSSLLAGLPE